MTSGGVDVYFSREDGISFIDENGHEIFNVPPDPEVLLDVREAIDDLIATLRHAAH